MPTLPPGVSRRSSALTFSDIFDADVNGANAGALCDARASHWISSARDNCAEGTAYCWMSCLPLPDDDGDGSVDCTDEAECVNDVGDPCFDDSMDETCHWTCPAEESAAPRDDFCNGKADMLMGGFGVAGDEDNPCVILFFDAWTLDEPWKFALGCVGVALIGVAAEALIFFRRRWRRSHAAQAAYVFVEGCSYAGSVMLGYAAMLVAMTYSVELFLSVCLGLVLGHAAFNLK